MVGKRKSPAAGPTDRKLVRPAVVAEQYGVHPRTIRDWITQGLIVGYRLGPRVLLVDPSEVEKLLRPIPAARRVRQRPGRADRA